MTKHNLEKRIINIEKELNPGKRVLVAMGDMGDPEMYTLEGKTYSREQLNALEDGDPNTILFIVCHKKTTIPNIGRD